MIFLTRTIASILATIAAVPALTQAVSAQAGSAPPVPAQSEDRAALEPAEEAIDWADTARRDVLSAYDVYVRNHPGLYDLANPGFPAQLSEARTRALEAAETAQDLRGYSLALAVFSSVLEDGHALAVVMPDDDADAVPVWPGFIAAWRRDALFVRMQDSTDPMHGARFVACDGQPIEPFLRERLITRYFRAGEAGQWWIRPMQLFYAHSGLQDEQPRACTFALPDGSHRQVTLDWRPLTQEESAWRNLGFWGEREATALTEKRAGMFFIGLQDFQPDEDGIADFEQMYRDVRARRDALKQARALVLDLRRNNGGDSRWSERLAHILWGKEAVETRTTSSAMVYWRTSPGNIAHVADIAKRYEAGGYTDVARRMARLAEGMQLAADRGEPLFAESTLADDAGDAEQATDGSPATDFETPVYAIVSGNCASSCLNALDYFTAFENVTIIGAPSSADSTYMDVRTENLPAGPGIIVIPNKVYAGRKRGWGDIHSADIEMTDLDWSTDTFLDWIERDLAER